MPTDRIGDGLAGYRVDGEPHLPAGRRRGHLRLPYRRRQEPGDVEPLPVQRYHPGVDPGQVEQLGHQPAEALGLRERGAQRVRVGHPVDHVLQYRLQREDRGAQLVRHVRDQFPPLPVGRGQVGGHLVERGGELADLVARRRPDPPAVVAPRHRLGRGGHLPQRPGHPVREDLRDQQRDPDRSERGGRRLPAQDAPEHGEPGHAAGQDHQAELELDERHEVQRAGHLHRDTSRE